MDNVLIYSDAISNCEYSRSHPYKPERARQLLHLLNRYSLLYGAQQKIMEPVPVDRETLCRFHDADYIDLIERCDRGEFTLDMIAAGIGTDENPVFDNMFNFVLATTGGTLQGARMLVNNEARFVFNPIGGFHHAGREHAEGFCYVNDIAIAITELLDKGFRIAYIDIDVHHGNGVQDAFYDTDRVLTISLHESGESLYPGSGFENEMGAGPGLGYTINLPFLMDTDDAIYTDAFEKIVPPVVKRFAPDLIIADIGTDAHRDDPLAHLNLTSNGYVSVIESIKAMGPKVLALGAGGYNVFKTAALWTLAWAAFCGMQPDDAFVGSVGGMMFGPESQSGSLHDQPYAIEGEIRERCAAQARRITDYIIANHFPVLGI